MVLNRYVVKSSSQLPQIQLKIKTNKQTQDTSQISGEKKHTSAKTIQSLNLLLVFAVCFTVTKLSTGLFPGVHNETQIISSQRKLIK